MSKPKLYEINVMVSYSTVILATSEKDAMDHIKSWEECWPNYSDFLKVSDKELSDIRKLTAEDWTVEAHDITANARKQIKAKP